MVENPISHVVSVLKGAVEQIERSQSTVSTSLPVSTSSSSHVSIPALPVSPAGFFSDIRQIQYPAEQ